MEKVRKGLSAGRVQSVALRLVVEREREIENFVSKEYWSVEGDFLDPTSTGDNIFSSQLVQYRGKKPKLDNESETREVVEVIKNEKFHISDVIKKERQRRAVPPFITSTLQQEASRKLRFPVKKTMSIAQKLYEGLEIGADGPVGLITYMRTDSVRISGDAINESRKYIEQKYGTNYLPEKPNIYKVKKSAQDAHEAIRPTTIKYDPDSVKRFLSEDEETVYLLIWQRF